jgi:hypothetical protein
MLDVERALKQDRLLRALTGLNWKAFDALLPIFSEIYEQTCFSQPRQRAIGGGRKARLRHIQDKLFFILFYFKCYPTFDVAGLLFDMHRSQAHEWMHRLQKVLETALGQKMVLPERKIDSIEAFLECFPAVKRVMIDGTIAPNSTSPRPRTTAIKLLW